ncbi:kinase-like protein, partial [Athelia psychrophila]
RRMGRELVRAVGWLHSVGVGHRDVKLENILLSQSPSGPLDPHAPLVTLTDFGLARAIAPGELLSTRCGSEAYAAPELVLPPAGGWYDARQTDAWAVGCVLFAL